MKLEMQKVTKLPKYAAALMCIAAVPMLTGCCAEKNQLAGETAVNYEPELEIAGNEQIYTEPDLELGGDEPVYSEPDIIEAPEQQPMTPERLADESADAFCEAFERVGLRVHLLGYHNNSAAQLRVRYGDADFVGAFIDENEKCAVCFYDGNAPLTYWNMEEDVKGTFAEMFDFKAQRGADAFSWGCADHAEMIITPDFSPIYRVAFVDASRFDSISAEEAEQIMQDAMDDYLAELRGEVQ